MSDANINLQMFYWAAESTGLNVTASLFDYLSVSEAVSLQSLILNRYRKRGFTEENTLPKSCITLAMAGSRTMR